MKRIVEWWDRQQVPLYLLAIGVGAVLGLSAPQLAPALELGIEPVLMLLLFATFLGVPLVEVARSFGDFRFLGTVLVANFVFVPAIAWASHVSWLMTKRCCSECCSCCLPRALTTSSCLRV